MKKQNKVKVTVAEQESIIFDEECKELIAAMVEDSQIRLTQVLDPFENYVQRIGSKVHLDHDQFKNRFVKGYQVLLEELKRELTTH